MLTLLLVFSVIYSITLGRYGVSVTNVWLILWNHVVPVANPTWSDVDANVVEAIRLPRILAALLVGAGLAISGAALQGLFRNPLVDPGIIGVTAGAGFGGTLAILLVGGGTIVLGAAFGFGIASLLVVRLPGERQGPHLDPDLRAGRRHRLGLLRGGDLDRQAAGRPAPEAARHHLLADGQHRRHRLPAISRCWRSRSCRPRS